MWFSLSNWLWSEESSVRLFDIKNKKNPELVKSFDFEGDYITSRKIGSYIYFVITTTPNLKKDYPVPMYKEDKNSKYLTTCDNIGYIEPVNAQKIISVISLSLSNHNKKINPPGRTYYAWEKRPQH